LLIVLGGVPLVWEKSRPTEFRAVGLVLAVVIAVLFALRDNFVRYAADSAHPPPVAAAGAALIGGAVAVLIYLLATRFRWRVEVVRRTTLVFLPSGLALGFAYIALVGALDRGQVTVVAPLNATQSLWAVAAAAVIFKQREAVGVRLVLAAVLIVAGGALVSAFR
jgi:drug/metabolite transporter (DMT)-like permease